MSPRALTTITLTARGRCGRRRVRDHRPLPPQPPAAPSPPPSTSTSTTTTSAAAADSGDPAPERGGTIPAAAQAAQHTLAAGAAAPTPRAALERYARLYLNWTAAGLVARERQLAALALGQARAQALQAAAGAARDPELTRSHVTNTGQLIAITPGTGAASRPLGARQPRDAPPAPATTPDCPPPCTSSTPKSPTPPPDGSSANGHRKPNPRPAHRHRRRHRHRASTAGGVALGAVDPGLAGATAPHPTLTGSVGGRAGHPAKQPARPGRPVPAVAARIPHAAGWPAGPGTSSSSSSPPTAPSRSASSSGAGARGCCPTCPSCRSSGPRWPSPSAAGC